MFTIVLGLFIENFDGFSKTSESCCQPNNPSPEGHLIGLLLLSELIIFFQRDP